MMPWCWLLAAIESVEPTAWPLLGIMSVSVAMYAVGILLPGCSCCGCTLCTEGALPETVTVTFDGLASKAPGPNLITLSFSACYGSGAAAVVTAPGGDPETDKGPISAVSLTNGGSGYAKLGRVAPTLTVSGGTGTGATLTPSLSTSQDGCKLDRWALQSVAASGGTGYANGDALTITVAEGDTEVSAAAATLYLDKTAPTLTLSGAASATVSMSARSDGNFRVSAVAVTSGGSGYTEGQSLTFTVGANDETVAAAAAKARVVHAPPVNSLLYKEVSGSGAVLTPAWTLLPTNQWPAPHKKTYYLSSVTIANGGSGYVHDDLFEFYFASVADGELISGGTFYVDAVDGNGAITAVLIANDGGEYLGSRTDAIESVEITNPGSYYHDDPGARRVFVNAGGSYYREDASVAPYVAAVTVVIAQGLPSAGTGATLTATVESSTASANFGKITAVAITSGGTNYLAHELFDTCLSRFDGRSIVLTRSLPEWPYILPLWTGECVYRYVCQHDLQCGLEVEWAVVRYIGPDTPMVVIVGVFHPHGSIWLPEDQGVMTADELSPDCSDIDVTATGGENVPEGATAHVTGGGEYEATGACAIITQQDMDDLIIEASWRDLTLAGDTYGSGCGMSSYVAANTRITDSEWCTEWRAEKEALLANDPNSVVTCSEERWFDLQFIIERDENCFYRWRGLIALHVIRNAFIFYGNANFYSSATRECGWTYRVMDVPLDPNGIPDGQVVINGGQVEYSTNLGGIGIGGTAEDPLAGVRANFGDYLFPESACPHIMPTVTFSRLP